MKAAVFDMKLDFEPYYHGISWRVDKPRSISSFAANKTTFSPSNPSCVENARDKPASEVFLRCA